jgi:hypothetical protein
MSKLKNIRRGPRPEALRFVFYGVGGVGKSTLAASAPRPLFLDVNNGTGLLDVDRYPLELGPDGKYQAAVLRAAIEDVIAGDHDYQTLVIDGLGELEKMIWVEMMSVDSKKSGKAKTNIEDYGYGKGYSRALSEMTSLLALLDRLRARRMMNVIIIGHAVIAKRKNPDGIDWDGWAPNVHPTAADLLNGWADVMLFLAHEEGGIKKEGSSRGKGFSTGDRIVHSVRGATHMAKTRLPLAPSWKLPPLGENGWTPIAEAIAAKQISREGMIAAITEKLGDLDTERAEKVKNFLENDPAPAMLVALYLKLKGQ